MNGSLKRSVLIQDKTFKGRVQHCISIVRWIFQPFAWLQSKKNCIDISGRKGTLWIWGRRPFSPLQQFKSRQRNGSSNFLLGFGMSPISPINAPLYGLKRRSTGSQILIIWIFDNFILNPSKMFQCPFCCDLDHCRRTGHGSLNLWTPSGTGQIPRNTSE